MKRIESRDNKWIKRLNGLKIKKNRDKEGLFIAEGLRFIREIPKNWEVLAYAVSDAFAAENDLSPYEEKAEVLCLTDALLPPSAIRKTHREFWRSAKSWIGMQMRCLRKKRPFSFWRKN